MAIFGRGESRAEKKERKMNDEVTDYLSAREIDELDPKYNELVRRIAGDMKVNDIIKAWAYHIDLSTAERGMMNYATALLEQNWIVIKQQDDILSELKKINEK